MILERLRRENMSALYHFTSVENLPLIRQMSGICSKQILEEAGLWPCPEPGGNELSHELDRRNDNWDKVSLNFTPHTPMVYHKKGQSHLCFFVVNIEVASAPSVVFTDTNATKGNQHRGEGTDGLNIVDFDAVRSSPRPWDKDGWVRPVQAEVLVPGTVELGSVIKVVFLSDASMRESERLWGRGDHPPFRVAQRYFLDDPRGGARAPAFPHLKDLLLTDELVAKANVDEARTHRSRFARRPGGRITAVASVRALSGTTAEWTWNPGNHRDTTEFERSSDYRHWPSISMDRLPDGCCSMEYHLNGIRWSTIMFEIESR